MTHPSPATPHYAAEIVDIVTEVRATGERAGEGVAAVLAEHEPVIGRFGRAYGVVGCACMDVREWYAYVSQHGGPGWLAHAEHITVQAAALAAANLTATDATDEREEARREALAAVDHVLLNNVPVDERGFADIQDCLAVVAALRNRAGEA